MFNLVAQSKSVVDIMMYGTIAEWARINANDFARALKQAEDEGYEQANLRINSPGGGIFEGLTMIAQIKASPLTIHAYIDGMAASMASVIAVNADKVFIAKGARMMVHQASGGVIGSAKVIKTYADLVDSLNKTLAEMYSDKTGKPAKEILETWMAEGNDQWFDSKAALKEKLVDEVVSSKVKAPEKAEATYMEIAAHYENQIVTEETMDKAKLTKRLGLKATATDEEIDAAIEALEKKAEQTAGGAEEPAEGKTSEKMVEAFMKLGKKAGIVTEANEASMRKLAEADIDACMDLLPEAKEEGSEDETKESKDNGARLSDILAKAIGETKPKETKKWSDYTPDELKALEDKDPKAFQALFDAEYGNVNNG